MSLGRCMAGVTGRWEMRALTNECPSSSSSSSPPPSAPTLAETVQARRGRPQGVCGGQAGPCCGVTPRRRARSVAFLVSSELCGLCCGVPGLLAGPGPALPGSVALFFLCQVVLGNASPILSLSLLIPKWWRH